MKSHVPSNVTKVRLDLSDWLWHFTRDEPQALDTLLRILDDGHVLAGTDRYCLIPCVCLTETPLAESVRQRDVLAKANYKRLSGYGIGFRKSWVFARGGLPVIYQPANLRTALPADMQWRHCDFDLDAGVDFTWQREWRVPVNSLDFTRNDDPTVVVASDEEVARHFITSLYNDPVRDEEYVDFSWPVVTHESLRRAAGSNDVESYRYE